MEEGGGEGGLGGMGHAQLGSGCGRGPTKTPGLLKPPPLDESQGAVSGWNAGQGLKVQGYVLLVMSSTLWASLPLRAGP